MTSVRNNIEIISYCLFSAISCKPLLDPEQGSHYCFHPFGSNRFNSSCRFQCELGFQLVGEPQLLCQASGHWNHPVPLCQGMETRYQQCQNSCYIWCQSQKYFSLPISVEQCPVLNHTSISAGSMNCSHPIAPYSFNSTCEVMCNEGYEPSGPDQIRCDHTGQWTASVPACTSKVIVITSECKIRPNPVLNYIIA